MFSEASLFRIVMIIIYGEIFSTIPETNFNFSGTFTLRSADAFNLGRSQISSNFKELTDDKILDLDKLAAFADHTKIDG